ADSRASYQPENKKLEWWLLVVTAGGVAAMLAPGLLVWADIVHVPQEAQEVEALAQQWHWKYRLPGADGKLGTVSARFVTDDNPFGMNPADPNGSDDVLLGWPGRPPLPRRRAARPETSRPERPPMPCALPATAPMARATWR